MLIGSIYIIFILSVAVIVNSLLLWIFLNKKLKFWYAVKTFCLSAALNRLLLSGSGYAAMSLRLKNDNLPLHKSVSSFIALEFITIFPWLILGFYFGSKLTFKLPSFLIILLAIILIFAIYYKRKKTIVFIKEAGMHFKQIRSNILLVMPLILINLVLGVSYYYFLFKNFGFTFTVIDILRIATVSFSIGYLSPAPAGLGFKESGLVFMLMQKNIPLKDSISIAVADRMVVSGFYLILGLFFGAGTLFREMLSRFRRLKARFPLT